MNKQDITGRKGRDRIFQTGSTVSTPQKDDQMNCLYDFSFERTAKTGKAALYFFSLISSLK